MSTAPHEELAKLELAELRSPRWTPNRIVALATGAIGVVIAALSLAVAAGTPQAVGVAAGVLAVVVPAREWLIGWREHERRQGEGDQALGWDDVEEIVSRLGYTRVGPVAAARTTRPLEGAGPTTQGERAGPAPAEPTKGPRRSRRPPDTAS